MLDALERRDLSLGGEQSGHVIFADHATTGDGTLTGTLLLDVLDGTGQRLSALAGIVQRTPQVLEGGRRTDPKQLDTDRTSGAPPKRHRTSWATTAGCSCGRRAPSPWSG